MKALNFGCGNRIHADWINIDFSPIDNRVQKVNLLQPLPFGDNTFDVAYSSPFLRTSYTAKCYKGTQPNTQNPKKWRDFPNCSTRF